MNAKKRELCTIGVECNEPYINRILKKKVCERTVEEKKSLSNFRKKSYRKRKAKALEENDTELCQRNELQSKISSMEYDLDIVNKCSNSERAFSLQENTASAVVSDLKSYKKTSKKVAVQSTESRSLNVEILEKEKSTMQKLKVKVKEVEKSVW